MASESIPEDSIPLKRLSFSIVFPLKNQPPFVTTSSGRDPPTGKPTADTKEVSRLDKHSLETTDIFRWAFFCARAVT